MDICNVHPILYIGRDKRNGSYYFLSEDKGDGKFLAYRDHPYWMNCFGPPGNNLDLSADLPAEIMAEVILFVNGRVRYEVIPEKYGLGIPQQIIRHEIPSPSPRGEEVKSSSKRRSDTQTKSSDKSVSETKVEISDSCTGTSSGAGQAEQKSQKVEIPVKRPRGRPRRVAGPPMAGSDTDS
jgi:hypothetical protein